MDNHTQKLLKLKQQVADARERRIRAETIADSAERELTALGYNTVEDAEKALQKIDSELLIKQEQLERDMETLYKKYPEL